MRRALAISLTFLFGWIFVAPLLPVAMPRIFGAASASEAAVPACCRRGGRDHCMEGGAPESGEAASQGSAIGQLAEKCPYLAHSTVAAQGNGFNAEPRICTTEPVAEQALSIADAEANYRIAAGPSHQKRGPPAFSS